jgi:tRNA(fMet)-specific endonuclease VapC
MLVLDTNHVSELDRGSIFAANFERRRGRSKVAIFTTVVTMEEMLHGWIALIRQCRDAASQVACYSRLEQSVRTLADWDILPFDADAVRIFADLRKQRLRVGTMDLKIAAIVLAHDATLLTRNVVDFAKVPGLKIDNWLD